MFFRSLLVCAIAGTPAWACSVCDTKIELVPAHVGCLKARIADFIDEAKEEDPYLIDFVSCNTDGPAPGWV